MMSVIGPVQSHYHEGSPVESLWEGFVEKVGFEPRVKEWRSDGWSYDSRSGTLYLSILIGINRTSVTLLNYGPQYSHVVWRTRALDVWWWRVCIGYRGSLYGGVQQQMIASSPEFSPVLPPASSSSSSSSSWSGDCAADRVKSEEVCQESAVQLDYPAVCLCCHALARRKGTVSVAFVHPSVCLSVRPSRT